MKARKLWITGAIGCVVLCIFVALWSSFSNFIHDDRKNQCLGNLDLIVMSGLMYSSDYDMHLPASGSWMDEILPYLKVEAVFHCPELPSSAETTARAYGYAFNQFLAGSNVDMTSDTDKKPEIYETSHLEKSVWGFLTDVPNRGRHEGMNMFGFVDGHVKGFPGRLP